VIDALALKPSSAALSPAEREAVFGARLGTLTLTRTLTLTLTLILNPKP